MPTYPPTSTNTSDQTLTFRVVDGSLYRVRTTTIPMTTNPNTDRGEGGEDNPMPTIHDTALEERHEAAIIELARLWLRSENPTIRSYAGQIIARDRTFQSLEDALMFMFMFRFSYRESDTEVSQAMNRSGFSANYLTAIARASGEQSTVSTCGGCGSTLGITVLCQYCDRTRRSNAQRVQAGLAT